MKYRTIVADPPWDYDAMGKRHRGRSPRELPHEKYSCMTMEQLCALPIADIAEDNAHLYLWVTNAFVHEGFHLCEAWGFGPRTMITWAKDKMGLGWYFRGQTEHMIFAVRGSCPVAKRGATLFHAPRTTHSRKPEEAYRIIEAASPTPYIELFARPLSPLLPKRDGWHVWGNEVESDISLGEEVEARPQPITRPCSSPDGTLPAATST